MSLGAAAAIQACVTVLQFFMIRYGHRVLLSEWGLDSATFFIPRDSTNVYREAGRLTGLTTSPTLLAMILTMTWPALLIEKTQGRKSPSWENALKSLLIVCSVWAVLLTYTRASYIGLGLQVLAISFLVFTQAWRGRVKISRVNLLMIAVALCSALIFIPASGARVTAIADAADASITNRLAVYHVAANLISERPISGWGPGFFNILYNHFYKLPHVGYSFFDTHSATFNTLMEIGIAGLFLGVIAIFGIRWKTLFRKTPRWVWISILGVALPITTDNPSSSPALMFPAIWILGVLCVSSVAVENRSVRLRAGRHGIANNPVVGFAFAAILLGVWLLGYLQPLKSTDQRFTETLRKAMPVGTREFGFYVHDNVTGRTWEYNANKLMDGASIVKLAIAATLLSSTEPDDSVISCPLEMTNAWARGSGTLHVLPNRPTTVTVGNALYLMLSESDNSCANVLFDFLGQDKISSVTKALIGRAVVFEAGGFGRGVTAGNAESSDGAEADEYAGAKISAGENAILLETIMNSVGPLAETAHAALRRNDNRWGLNRYLVANGLNFTYHKSGTANGAVNHVMIYRHASSDWVVSVMLNSIDNYGGVDRAAFYTLARIGWVCCTLLKYAV